jgi:hypothetical protein
MKMNQNFFTGDGDIEIKVASTPSIVVSDLHITEPDQSKPKKDRTPLFQQKMNPNFGNESAIEIKVPQYTFNLSDVPPEEVKEVPRVKDQIKTKIGPGLVEEIVKLHEPNFAERNKSF